MAYPGVYPDDDKIIPHSPRREFGFASPISEITTDKIIKLESMKNMPIDQIVDLYKDGYKIEDTSPTSPTSPTIATAQGGVSISAGALLLIGIGILAYLYIKKK